jgi:hypothetical protein
MVGGAHPTVSLKKSCHVLTSFIPDNPLGSDTYVGAALAAITPSSSARSVAAKAAPTKTMLQLKGRRISLMNYLGLCK